MNTNIPYRKQYDAQGNITNPIKERYISVLPNRAERRRKEGRFHGNGNNYHLTISAGSKYRREMQFILTKENKIKVIYHYK